MTSLQELLNEWLRLEPRRIDRIGPPDSHTSVYLLDDDGKRTGLVPVHYDADALFLFLIKVIEARAWSWQVIHHAHRGEYVAHVGPMRITPPTWHPDNKAIALLAAYVTALRHEYALGEVAHGQ